MVIPATAKKVVINGIVISKVVGRKVVEDWEIVDALGLMTQLGAIPSPGAKK